MNKDTETPGGTTGFSLRSGAVQRFYMTAKYRNTFLVQIRNIVDGNKAKLQHPDLQQRRIQKDAETVATVCELVQGWINPFAENQDLLSISTARKAPREFASDLMKAHDIGQQCYSDFNDQRLEKDLQ